jgi:hypothetical protein
MFFSNYKKYLAVWELAMEKQSMEKAIRRRGEFSGPSRGFFRRVGDQETRPVRFLGFDRQRSV